MLDVASSFLKHYLYWWGRPLYFDWESDLWLKIKKSKEYLDCLTPIKNELKSLDFAVKEYNSINKIWIWQNFQEDFSLYCDKFEALASAHRSFNLGLWVWWLSWGGL